MAVLRSFPVVVEVWGWDEAFVGVRTDMPEVYRAADVVLLPSTYGVEALARTFGPHPDWAFVLGDLGD